MNKEEAKLKLVMILSNKDLIIERRKSWHDVTINNSIVFSTENFYNSSGNEAYSTSINDYFKGSYIFHIALREALNILDDKEVFDIVIMKEDIGGGISE